MGRLLWQCLRLMLGVDAGMLSVHCTTGNRSQTVIVHLEVQR